MCLGVPVIPSEFGVPQRWYFPCSPRYWGCCERKAAKKKCMAAPSYTVSQTARACVCAVCVCGLACMFGRVCCVCMHVCACFFVCVCKCMYVGSFVCGLTCVCAMHVCVLVLLNCMYVHVSGCVCLPVFLSALVFFVFVGVDVYMGLC